ncbi:MAG: DUF4926 domain-containing protein [Chloroflexota bacterium]|nr:DUF4926 domain-containing protein [Chloroflexota bacterium]MDE2886323.1 DUF4926 domain-containing protein [Chloroflexota bacterium]
MKLKEHDVVTLVVDLPSDGLRVGEVGTVVHVHGSGKAFVVEFADHETPVFATVLPAQVSERRPIHGRRLPTSTR